MTQRFAGLTSRCDAAGRLPGLSLLICRSCDIVPGEPVFFSRSQAQSTGFLHEPKVYEAIYTAPDVQQTLKNILRCDFTIYAANDLIWCWCGGLAPFFLLCDNCRRRWRTKGSMP